MSSKLFSAIIAISLALTFCFWFSIFKINNSDICEMYEKQIKLIQDTSMIGMTPDASVDTFIDEISAKEFIKITTIQDADMQVIYTTAGDIVSVEYESHIGFDCFLSLLMAAVSTIFITGMMVVFIPPQKERT